MSLQYLKKEVRDEVMSLFMRIVNHSQVTQSNKFAISLQYLTKEARD